MKVGVPKETRAGERRVALVPDLVQRYAKLGGEVIVEHDAGKASFFLDVHYREAGATIAAGPAELYADADFVLKVQRPQDEEIGSIKSGTALVALLQPLSNIDLIKQLADGGVTSFSMDAIPRIARAQKMDALTSQSSVAGYKAALVAADALGKHLPLMMTAAGTMPPAKGLVLGAGVAGLQAIATARRLGAVLEAFDVRPAVKEQVESLGATFIEDEVVSDEAEDAGGYATELSEDHQRREQEMIHRHVRDADFVITTALIPGRLAPLLVTEEMVADMKPGSVIIDLAAETGGNCAMTTPGESVLVGDGVLIHGPLNLPSEMPIHASQMYARNIFSFFEHLVQDGELKLDFEDAITKDACITHEGKIVQEATLAAADAAAG
ncbi:MAG: Re/Si-specific NAD(P)(+) transhydrogenase subunit alpha [Dehalococcoidia bacterium]|nr:Re/Si-specific NAD(P)(+) transhydrogenase subunit alpha [Dehalococcoidia bacterium]